MNIQDRLRALSDKEYAQFHSKLIPNVPEDTVLGVRVPILRKFAKEYAKEEESVEFMRSLPHQYYDENMLHGLLIEQIKDYDQCIEALSLFLPYVDNWAVCDIMKPKVLSRNRERYHQQCLAWISSKDTYTCRYGMEAIMNYFLDEDFDPEDLAIIAKVESDEYYVNMMIAWFFATALSKQWNTTIVYVEENRLPIWVHNKTIQKGIESNRLTKEQKDYLKSLRRVLKKEH